ncbi:MAG: MliC family protein [Desulfobacterales bacterium]
MGEPFRQCRATVKDDVEIFLVLKISNQGGVCKNGLQGFIQRCGTKYQGRNETFWEHQGEASITWGYGTPQKRCKKAP